MCGSMYRCPTVAAPFVGASIRRVYFEIEYLDTSGPVVVGVAGSNFGAQKNASSNDVGSDAISWGVVSDGSCYHR